MNPMLPPAVLLLTATLTCQLDPAYRQDVRSLPGSDGRRFAFDPATLLSAVVMDDGLIAVQSLGLPATFQGLAATPTDVAFGDYNADGLLDLAVAYGAYGVRVYDFANIANPIVWSLPAARGVTFADIDGDGFDDILLRDPNAAGLNGTVRFFSGQTQSLMWTATGQSQEGLGDQVAIGEAPGYTGTQIWASASFAGSGIQGAVHHIDPITGATTQVLAGSQSGGGLGRDGLEIYDGMLVTASQVLGIGIYAVNGSVCTPQHVGLGSYIYDLWVTHDTEADQDVVVGLQLSGSLFCYELQTGQPLFTTSNAVRPFSNNWDNYCGDTDGDGRINFVSLQSGTYLGAPVNELLVQTVLETEAQANQNEFASATGGIQIFTGNRPSEAGQIYLWVTSFEFTPGSLPLPGGDVLNLNSPFVFPDGSAAGLIDAAGGFTAQWGIPAGAPVGTCLHHNFLALDPGPFVFRDSNYQRTLILP